MKLFSPIGLTLLIAMVMLVSGCAPVTRAVVVERKVTGVKQETEKIGGAVVRIVQPGDTLYAIAFAHGLDARDLAAWNGLSANNRIQIDQKLRLTKPLGFVAQQPVKQSLPNTETTRPNSSAKTNTKVAKRRSVEPKKNERSGAANKPIPSVAGKSTASVIARATVWQWPIKGKLIRGFALNQGQQGIDIQGVRGQSVMAGAAGEIVYVGNGLKGYGNLIIIKHDDEFLSAYAHNQAVFVKEGEQVKGASVIASIGINQKGESALQFQIRKRGSPVNPLSYLPSRR